MFNCSVKNRKKSGRLPGCSARNLRPTRNPPVAGALRRKLTHLSCRVAAARPSNKPLPLLPLATTPANHFKTTAAFLSSNKNGNKSQQNNAFFIKSVQPDQNVFTLKHKLHKAVTFLRGFLRNQQLQLIRCHQSPVERIRRPASQQSN